MSGEINFFVADDWRGWKIEEDNGRFEVYYNSGEAMRLGSDGSLSCGEPEGYWFQTREWAELCLASMKRLDDAFGRGASFTFDASGNFGIGVTASNWRGVFQIMQGGSQKPLVEVSHGGVVTHFDLPAFVRVWWRNTAAHRVIQTLLWGERGRT